MANCDRMVRDCIMVTMECLWETTIALSNGTIADPVRPPFPQNMGSTPTHQDQLRDACCHLANKMEDILCSVHTSVCCVGWRYETMSLLPYHFGPCLSVWL